MNNLHLVVRKTYHTWNCFCSPYDVHFDTRLYTTEADAKLGKRDWMIEAMLGHLNMQHRVFPLTFREKGGESYEIMKKFVEEAGEWDGSKAETNPWPRPLDPKRLIEMIVESGLEGDPMEGCPIQRVYGAFFRRDGNSDPYDFEDIYMYSIKPILHTMNTTPVSPTRPSPASPAPPGPYSPIPSRSSTPALNAPAPEPSLILPGVKLDGERNRDRDSPKPPRPAFILSVETEDGCESLCVEIDNEKTLWDHNDEGFDHVLQILSEALKTKTGKFIDGAVEVDRRARDDEKADLTLTKDMRDVRGVGGKPPTPPIDLTKEEDK